MIDSYHLPDDAVVLPQIITGADPGYEASCGFCDYSDKTEAKLIPHTVFYESRTPRPTQPLNQRPWRGDLSIPVFLGGVS